MLSVSAWIYFHAIGYVDPCSPDYSSIFMPTASVASTETRDYMHNATLILRPFPCQMPATSTCKWTMIVLHGPNPDNFNLQRLFTGSNYWSLSHFHKLSISSFNSQCSSISSTSSPVFLSYQGYCSYVSHSWLIIVSSWSEEHCSWTLLPIYLAESGDMAIIF